MWGASYLSRLLGCVLGVGLQLLGEVGVGQGYKAGSLGKISHGLKTRTKREAGNSEKEIPSGEVSCDALFGHWRPKFLCP